MKPTCTNQTYSNYKYVFIQKNIDISLLNKTTQFKLDELVKELSISDNALNNYDAAINQLIKSLKNLKPKPNIKYSDLTLFEANKLDIPLGDLCKTMEEGTYSFLAPSSIKVIGSYSTKTVLKMPKITVDISVEISDDYFDERDYLNYRYFMKRNLYLAHVYIQLIDKKKYSDLKYEFIANYASNYKPLLLISLNG